MTDTNHRTFVIAEMACSHDGDTTLARRIIDGAGQAGADAIQFQIWRAATFAVPWHPQYELLQKIELPNEAWGDLSSYVRENYPKMQIIACVYDRDTMAFSESIGVDAYKIHSADLSNRILLESVAKTGKRIDLSIGSSTIAEIADAVNCIREISQCDIWLMYGIQNFPTPIDVIRLDYMMKLKQLFELPMGYQDHSDAEIEAAFWLPAVAIGMGANILEKHITYDRAARGVDYEAALNPDEFARFTNIVRDIESARGIGTPVPFSEEEIKYRSYAKKRIVASRDMKEGTILTEDDLLFVRAEEPAMTPDQTDQLLGYQLIRDIKTFHLFCEDDVI